MLGFVDHQRDGMENKLLLFVIPVCATRLAEPIYSWLLPDQV